jgi:hypothetical protein
MIGPLSWISLNRWSCFQESGLSRAPFCPTGGRARISVWKRTALKCATKVKKNRYATMVYVFRRIA